MELLMCITQFPIRDYKRLPEIGCVYEITHSESEKPYIGRTINLKERARRHYQDLSNGTQKNPKMQNIHNKYGDMWTIRVIEECSEKDGIDLEGLILSEVNLKNVLNCHTNSIGGSKDQVWTKEQRQRQSEMSTGRKWSNEQKQRQSERLSGNPSTVAHCMSIYKKGVEAAKDADVRKKAIETRRKSSGGKFFSEEVHEAQKQKARDKVFKMLEWAINNNKTRADAIKEFGSSWGSLKTYLPEWEALNGTLPIFNKHQRKEIK